MKKKKLDSAQGEDRSIASLVSATEDKRIYVTKPSVAIYVDGIRNKRHNLFLVILNIYVLCIIFFIPILYEILFII